MSLLFVNACSRKDSQSERLARMWLEQRGYEGEVKELRLRDENVFPLDASDPNGIDDYAAAVASKDYSHPMFGYAQEFARADEVLIAAPFWNYGILA